jgi:hypothetical protein
VPGSFTFGATPIGRFETFSNVGFVEVDPHGTLLRTDRQRSRKLKNIIGPTRRKLFALVAAPR